LVEQPQHGAQVHAGATGAERQLAIAEMKGAQVNAMADSIPDGIGFSQKTGGRVEQPSQKQQPYWQQKDHFD
jgi:hypothetical protein